MPKENILKKFNLEENDEIELKLKSGRILKGVVLPSQKYLTLKLDSGYNVGISSNKISSVKKLGKRKTGFKYQKMISVANKPTVAILHTGGTIASRIDYATGAVKPSFSVEDLLALFPELGEKCNIDSKMIFNKFSEELNFGDYERIIEEVKKEIEKGVKGIILAHGTDTMHFTAAALSFAFENIPLPLILVGAQRSSDRGSSDAAMNLLCAADVIVNTDFRGVAVCMHASTEDKECVLLPGVKCRKMHTSRRDAFKAINAKPIAKINYENSKVVFLRSDYERVGDDKSKNWRVFPKFENKVALVKYYPNMDASIFEMLADKKYKGVVIEGTGLGHTASALHKPIKELIDNGCIVAMASQCIFGRVNMNVYSTGRRLLQIGVLPCEDMAAETAFVKLAWLLGNFSKEEAKLLFSKNLRGEISARSNIAIDLWEG